jgi:hypothetical protein
MAFSALEASCQKSVALEAASSVRIFSPNAASSKTPPGILNVGSQFRDRG